jgi:hypothetical protein
MVLQMILRSSASIMRLAAAIALALGAASAQVQVTLEGAASNVQDGPIGLLDGPCAMGAWSSSASYHSLEAVSYDGTWYRAIARSGPGTIAGPVTPGSNGNYWAASANNLTGSGANFTCNLWGTSGSGRAQSSNPAFTASQAGATTYVATGFSTAAGGEIGGLMSPSRSGSGFGQSFNCALQWAAEGAPDVDTNGYLQCAEAAILNAEDYFSGAALCDLTTGGCGAYFAGTDYDSYWAPWLATIYSIVRDKLSTTQRTTFNNKIWNDNSSSNNGLGINGNPSGSCAPAVLITSASGTITTHSWVSYLNGQATVPQTMTVTGVGTHFTTDLSVGDVLYGIGHVGSIQSDTTLTLTAPAGLDTSGVALNTVAVAGWNDANTPCGLVWYLKHHGSSPPVGTGNYSTSYQGGGTYVSAYINLVITKLAGYIPLALATAADDSRAETAATQYYNWWHDNTQVYLHQEPTGFYRPRGYTSGRDQWMLLEIILALNNAVPSLGANSFLGYWSKNIMPFWYYGSMNNVPGGYMIPWAGDFQNSQYGVEDVLMAAALYPGSPEAAQVNYWQKSTRRDYSTSGPYSAQSDSEFAPALFVLSDPGNAGTSPSSLPTQYIFDQTDLNPGGGPSSLVAPCTYWNWETSYNQDCRLNYWISRTGFGATDSIVFQQAAWYDGGDHQSDNLSTWGSISILRQGYLLNADNLFADSNYPGGRAMIAIGTWTGGGCYSGNWQCADGIHGWPASEIRWAGSHPGGVSTSKYAYSEVDLNNTYQTPVTHALREVAHMKGGSQDYVIVHDYVTVPSGTTIQSLWPLFRGPDQAAFYAANTVTTTNWASSQTAQVVGSAASLILQALPTSANSLATIDLGMGQNSMAHMLGVCASSNGTSCNSSATSMEEIVVAKPANTTSPSMPALMQLTAGANWAVVQIADSSSPKVAAFAKGAATQSFLSFTSTHSGTAQYMIAGLSPGTYSVTQGSTAVSGSPFTVVYGDNTLYFEGTAGNYSIASTGTTGSGPDACDLNGDSVVNILDVQLATSQALGITPCTTGNLTGNGCNVVDVQIVVNAVLTGVCSVN